jgi:hypothetical protein
MTLPTNDFSSRELPIEELEAIAAGGFWSWIKHEASTVLHYAEPVVVAIVKAIEHPRPPGKWL